MGQIVRALEDSGPCSPEDLGTLIGARYWESGRFDRALAFAIADGLVVRGPDGELQPSG
jgi:hypothetical protein